MRVSEGPVSVIDNPGARSDREIVPNRWKVPDGAYISWGKQKWGRTVRQGALSIQGRGIQGFQYLVGVLLGGCEMLRIK